MKFGDLSNKLAPIIGFRFENVIRKEDGKLNTAASAFIQDRVLATGCNVYIITSGERRKALAFCVKYNVQWTQVIEVDSILEIPEVCIANKMLIYYDTNKEVLYNINARGKDRVKAQEWI